MQDITDFEINDDLLNQIHQPASLSQGISVEDVKLSMNQKMIVSYDLIDLSTDYGFMQVFTQDEIHGYFCQMKKYASKSMNEVIDTLDYTEHFNESKIKGKLLDLLKVKAGKRIDDDVLIYHFALETEKRTDADRSKGQRNARVYFLVGKYGVIHVLFFDPFHEINA